MTVGELKILLNKYSAEEKVYFKLGDLTLKFMEPILAKNYLTIYLEEE